MSVHRLPPRPTEYHDARCLACEYRWRDDRETVTDCPRCGGAAVLVVLVEWKRKPTYHHPKGVRR